MKTIKLLTLGLLFCALIVPNVSNSQTVSSSEEIEFSVWIPCAGEEGEMAIGTITLHHLLGKNFWQANPQGGELIGQVTGTVYHPTGLTRQTNIILDEDGCLVYTYVNVYHMVGGGIQFMVKEVGHARLIEGEIVSEVDQFETWCK